MKINKRRLILIAAAALFVVILGIILFVYNLNQKNSNGLDNNSIQYYSQLTGMNFVTEDGFYYTNSSNFIHFYDYETQEDVIVCNKPNCKHETWNEDTPEEQRCNAYLTSSAVGFISDEKLYILTFFGSSETGKLTLTRSDLDRSNQTVIAELESDFVYTMAVKDNTMYLANILYIYDQDTEGLPVMSGQSNTWLYAVDLQSGKTTELTERQQGYSADLHIVGVNGDKIYLTYEYFENKYDGTNYDEAKHHGALYSYDTTSGEFQEMQLEVNEDVYYDYVYGSKIIGKTSNDNDKYEILELDVETGETETIDSCDESPEYLDGNVIYKKEDEYFMYNIEKGTTEQMNDNVVSEFYIQSDAGKYIYGYRVKSNEEQSYPSLILKEDLYNGKQNYIELNFYEDSE